MVNSRGPRRTGITLVEVLVALALVSAILLPIGMFVVEYLKGSSDLGETHQVLSLLEEKMELALSGPYTAFPVGVTEGKPLVHDGRVVLDLRPAEVGPHQVRFSLTVEMVPTEFAAITDVKSGRGQRVSLEEGFKRLTLRAVWGRKGERFFDLCAYKADL